VPGKGARAFARGRARNKTGVTGEDSAGVTDVAATLPDVSSNLRDGRRLVKSEARIDRDVDEFEVK
jgi:hypothetical protein